MRHTTRRAQGRTPKRAEQLSPAVGAIVSQFAWPVARTIPLQGGRLIELIASCLGPIGIYYEGRFVAQMDPAELASLGSIAAELAANLSRSREVPHG